MKKTRHPRILRPSTKGVSPNSIQSPTARPNEFLEEVRHLRASLAIYRHVVDRLLQNAPQ